MATVRTIRDYLEAGCRRTKLDFDNVGLLGA